MKSRRATPVGTGCQVGGTSDTSALSRSSGREADGSWCSHSVTPQPRTGCATPRHQTNGTRAGCQPRKQHENKEAGRKVFCDWKGRAPATAEDQPQPPAPAPEHARGSASVPPPPSSSHGLARRRASQPRQAVAHAPPHERINTSRSAFLARAGPRRGGMNDWIQALGSPIATAWKTMIERTRPGPAGVNQVGVRCPPPLYLLLCK